MINSRLKHITGILIINIILFQCSTGTNIQTEPSGLDVYYEGQNLGKSPVAYEISNLVFQEHMVEIKKDGKTIRKFFLSKEVKVGPLVACLFCLIPCLWIYGPRSYQSFEVDLEDFKKRNASKSSIQLQYDRKINFYIGNQKIEVGEISEVDPGEYEVTVCDENKCEAIGLHKFEKHSTYIYQFQDKPSGSFLSLN